MPQLQREVRFKPRFDEWRTKARALLDQEVAPPEVLWKSQGDAQEELEGLFANDFSMGSSVRPLKRHSVPAEFMKMAPYVAANRDSQRWPLLYRILWRLTHGEPELLRISVDPDTMRWDSMYRSVRRDLHKMTAFVRFRELRDANGGESNFVAWYEPDHLIVPLASNFFRKRFQGMKWSILTADECMHWDGQEVSFSPGCPKSMAPKGDDVEGLWKTYYASIFNPSRIKTRAMKKELPVRYWKNLPEAGLISGLIQSAPKRLQDFYANQPKRAESWFPAPKDIGNFDRLKTAAASCRACPLCERATQTVFGEGPLDAKIVFVGEQPGDQEDLTGRPFQGPAGKLLDQAFEEAGIKRSEVYVTNAVKHFKWRPNGKMRLHQTPNSSEIAACKPWLGAELALLKPDILVCLGASAAQSIFGKVVRLAELAGCAHSTNWCEKTFVLKHPAAILRELDPGVREAEYRVFVEQLRALV